MQVMIGVTIPIIKSSSAQRIRERMAIETMDHTVAPDFQNFESLMKDFQKYFESHKADRNAAFPEAIYLQKFGSPGTQGSWWNVYQW